MTVLKPADIAVHAAAAGFTGDALVKAVAVALAESGGNTKAVGVNSDRWRSRDRGLWQINDHWHPEVTDAQAFDPNGCARAAFAISSRGTNWSPWSTWKNGSAQAQLGRARLGVAALDGNTYQSNDSLGEALLNDPMGTLGQAVKQSPVTAIAGSVLSFGAWIGDSHNWFRVALVVGGAGSVVLGLNMLARSGAAGDGVKAVAQMPGKIAGAAVGVGTTVATGGASAAAKAAKAVK